MADLDGVIRLRFVRSKYALSWLISWYSDMFWASHVEAIMPDGQFAGACFDGCKIRPAGYDAHSCRREVRVTIACSKAQEEAFYGFLRETCGAHYDFMAVLAFMFRRNWNRSGDWYCSEWQSGGLLRSLVLPPRVAVELNKLKPYHLWLLLLGRPDTTFCDFNPEEA